MTTDRRFERSVWQRLDARVARGEITDAKARDLMERTLRRNGYSSTAASKATDHWFDTVGEEVD